MKYIALLSGINVGGNNKVGEDGALDYWPSDIINK